MTEADRRRLITSTPHLTPDQVAQHGFSTSFRGYSEAEVRAFLKRVSEELVVTSDREAELLDAIDALEEQLRTPRPLDEAQLLDALGAETSRLLRSARDTADEIRTKAQEQAANAAEAASAAAERAREQNDEVARARVAEAEERAAALVADAERSAAEMRAATEVYAAEHRSRAEREAEEHVASALQQGREMLDEAKATRERVLADLFRRRALLQAQVDALRSGRDSLLDAYRVVKRTFLDATAALAQVEARAAERVASAVASAANVDGEGIAESDGDANVDVDADARGSDSDTRAETETPEGVAAEEVVVEGVLVVESSPAPSSGEAGEATDPNLADVESLFARIRAGQAEAAVAAAPVAAEVSAEAPAGPAPTAGADLDLTTGTDGEPDESTAGTLAPPPSAVESWRTGRAVVVDPLLVSVAKRAKRAAQDDQNALLDAVRRHKGRPTAGQVLTPEPELLAAWSGVIGDSIDASYGAGRVAVGGEATTADEEFAMETVAAIVSPLRERISAAIDSGEDGDTSGLVERIGARFREWKNQTLENSLADALAMAWSRGVYDAAPDGTVLQWIPLVEGRCADCDDNSLEPTMKGSSFPTGQLRPPAHPGCRCLLAPSDVLSGLTANA